MGTGGSASTRVAPEQARAGDWIEVDGILGAGPRRGEIVAVSATPGHVHFRVRWDEQHESLFYPAERGCIVHRHAAPERRGGS